MRAIHSGIGLLAVSAVLAATAVDASAQGLDPQQLAGLVVDDIKAEVVGGWLKSTHTPPFVAAGYLHDENKGKGEKSVRFTIDLPESGPYHVRICYSVGTNRASNVPVEIHHADGVATMRVDQRKSPPGGDPFLTLGSFRFEAGTPAVVVIGTAGTDGHVIADAVQWLPDEGTPLAAAPAATPAPEALPKRHKNDRAPAVERLTVDALDALVAAELRGAALAEAADDERFLRRVSLDLVGRPPSPEEFAALAADRSPDRRAKAVDRLLEDEAFGRNWANYWSDVIAYRVPQPELTFLSYETFKAWLASRLNAGAAWDDIAYEILTARGKVKDQPAATFVGFHQGNPIRLAGETTRVFLSVQLSCAECHDHPFEDWTRDQFHSMAAYFARTEAKLPWRDSDGIEVKSKDKGEYQLPDAMDPRKKGAEVQPVALTGAPIALGMDDLARRAALAEWVTHPENPWFARSYVNRVWGRMMGRAFVEPVENLASDDALWPSVHEQLTRHFVDSHYDVKGLFRLLTATQAYQRGLAGASDAGADGMPLAGAAAQPLSGDQVFDSLAGAVGLPDAKGEAVPHNDAFRFPPPPKSTRNRVQEAFGFDPSIDPRRVQRTMQQAMWMMNDAELARQIDARPESGSVLSRLLAEHKEDVAAVAALYRTVLARGPSAEELRIALAHVAALGQRGAAFEDLLWSLLNSAEFTAKR